MFLCKKLNKNNFNYYIRSNLYHSKNGVFGYKPNNRTEPAISADNLAARQQQSNLFRWVEAYRSHGHLLANVNSVNFRNEERTLDQLNAARYGFAETDQINSTNIFGSENKTYSIKEAKEWLDQTYCSNSVSAEYAYISSEYEKEWIAERFESLKREEISNETKVEIAELLLKSQNWDNFLATKFPTVKRYGGEGAESMFAFFRQIFSSATKDEIDHIVLGMPHRGKLNLLTTMLQTRPAKIFRKFKGKPEFPSDAKAMCDIASHFNASENLDISGKTIRISMLHNPSHLEAVNPVSMGKARSKQMTSRDGAFSDDKAKEFSNSVLNVQLHGDAAFAGQGLNQEMLMMTKTPHYDIGGTIHMVVNNQVGFTTPGDRGRTTNYCTDLAKSIEAPVFHVNADDPEMLTLISELAFDYQREFRKDVFIDLNCFRRWGHNEVDDPTFTNPALYKIIQNRKSIPDMYKEKLIEENVINTEKVESIIKAHTELLANELSSWESYEPEASYFQSQWTGFEQAPSSVTSWDTGIDYSLLSFIGRSSVSFPQDFNIHPHLLKTHVNGRLKRLQEGSNIDWATAEAMAMGSLMYQGYNVRISGEDVGRGTFSHRHAMLIDQETNDMYIPLNSLKGGLGGKLEVANSILSEEAVLGFEYGMAIDNPNNLIIWEAQFGDFFNGAQIIFDTFIASGETKWMTSNGMVILLPHGYDGAASEHSSCRIERFLQLTDSKESKPDGDDINLQIINPTTPAQYFHALRRQMVRNFRKPLVIVAPKTLLRLSDATSPFGEFEAGKSFLPVIGDKSVNPSSVKRVLLCSGKHYYNLNEERVKRSSSDVAIVRVESLCPFPTHELNEELDKYKNAKSFIWSQEEPRNMGAWSFVKPRFDNMLGRKIAYSGRIEGATPAVGVSSWHQKEAQEVVQNPFTMK